MTENEIDLVVHRFDAGDFEITRCEGGWVWTVRCDSYPFGEAVAGRRRTLFAALWCAVRESRKARAAAGSTAT